MHNDIEKQTGLVWAKADRDDGEKTHLLLFHLLESAAVALEIWNGSLSNSIKEEIANPLDLSIPDMGKMLAYWVGLHDIGKASPVFQSALEQKNPNLIDQIRYSGLPIDRNTGSAYHSHISGKFIKEHTIAPKEIEIAISGHHGLWNSSYDGISSYAYGGQTWDTLRSAYCEILCDVLGIQPLIKLEMGIEERNIFTTWFSGFICVADWISSNETIFEYDNKWMDPKEYFSSARTKATNALYDIGWIGWRPDKKTLTFHEMYPEYQPRDIQRQAIQAFEMYQSNSQFLMVMEAPTGCGKTETAMYIADHWLQDREGSGIYIAMPTQATSNQMYSRSLKVLAHRYANQKVNIVLAHGQARWNADLEKIRVAQVGDIRSDQGVMATEWFQNNRKRTLLAPFGVGTVDQIFLSILQTKHFFVRLFGLKNKVVIFDEVHAYDTYMNTLFYRLLEWLRGLGASVIILSATLPEKTRQEIVAHYRDLNGEQLDVDSHYPRMTLATPDKDSMVFPLRLDSSDRFLDIKWISEEDIPNLLAEQLSDGGCAAVICNTVRQAQQTYMEIRAQQLVDVENLILFHARFPFCWRKDIEEKVLTKFGKESTLENGGRPQKAIVVATQVIEQSLDLDFDIMVSELAPVDLILQRAGRLHRHTREDRPKKVSLPNIYLLDVCKGDDGVPLVGVRDPFYPKNVLLKTYQVLHQITHMEVVASTRDLIERAYDDREEWDEFPSAWNAKLKKWQITEKAKREIKTDDASFTLIDPPSSRRLLFRGTKQLEELDEGNISFLEQLQAKTRDGGISIRVPCLFSDDDITLYSDLECQCELNQEMGEGVILKTLSGNEVGISNFPLLKTIYEEAQDLGKYFIKIRKLKNKKILLFRTDQKKGVIDIGDFHLELSHELGLTYQQGGNNV